MSDAYYPYTVFLCHFNGANNSTVFTDEVGINITNVGSPKISTTQSKFGGSSGLFAGNGSLALSTTQALNFGSGDMTMEGWVYPTGSGSPLLNNQNSSNMLNLYLDSSTSGRLLLNSSNAITGITFTASTWQHLAVVRYGNVWTVYLNGTSVGSATVSGSFDLSYNTGIGGYGSGQYFNGYLDEIRITKGLARYTSNFTPATDVFDFPAKNYFLGSSEAITCAPGAFSGYTSGVMIPDSVITSASYYDGGVGYIDDYLIYDGNPAAREINLFAKKDKRLVATTWSDATTGYYKFDRLKNQEYFCVAIDYLKAFDHVSHDLIVEGV